MAPTGKARASVRQWAIRALAGANGRGARGGANTDRPCDRWRRGASRAIPGATIRPTARVRQWAIRTPDGANAERCRQRTRRQWARRAITKQGARSSMAPTRRACDRARTRARRALAGARGQGARSMAQLRKTRARLRQRATRAIVGARGHALATAGKARARRRRWASPASASARSTAPGKGQGARSLAHWHGAQSMTLVDKDA